MAKTPLFRRHSTTSNAVTPPNYARFMNVSSTSSPSTSNSSTPGPWTPDCPYPGISSLTDNLSTGYLPNCNPSTGGDWTDSPWRNNSSADCSWTTDSNQSINTSSGDSAATNGDSLLTDDSPKNVFSFKHVINTHGQLDPEFLLDFDTVDTLLKANLLNVEQFDLDVSQRLRRNRKDTKAMDFFLKILRHHLVLDGQESSKKGIRLSQLTFSRHMLQRLAKDNKVPLPHGVTEFLAKVRAYDKLKVFGSPKTSTQRFTFLAHAAFRKRRRYCAVRGDRRSGYAVNSKGATSAILVQPYLRVRNLKLIPPTTVSKVILEKLIPSRREDKTIILGGHPSSLTGYGANRTQGSTQLVQIQKVNEGQASTESRALIARTSQGFKYNTPALHSMRVRVVINALLGSGWTLEPPGAEAPSSPIRSFYHIWLPVYRKHISSPFDDMREDFGHVLWEMEQAGVLKSREMFLVFLEVNMDVIMYHRHFGQPDQIEERHEFFSAWARFLTVFIYFLEKDDTEFDKLELLKQIIGFIIHNALGDIDRSGPEFMAIAFKQLLAILLNEVLDSVVFRSDTNEVLFNFCIGLKRLRPSCVPCFAFDFLDILRLTIFTSRFNTKMWGFWIIYSELLADVLQFVLHWLRRSVYPDRTVQNLYQSSRNFMKYLNDFCPMFLRTFYATLLLRRLIPLSSNTTFMSCQLPTRYVEKRYPDASSLWRWCHQRRK